jgi:hypothetical protein
MHSTLTDPSARQGDWFLSSTGRQIYLFDLRPEDVQIEEIAHALSNLCRFNGHCREFYSVAQHSVLVSLAVPRELALAALLHDATEAYVGDMIRPLKRSMPEYSALEDRIWLVIAERFCLPATLPEEVKIADTRALQTERRDLLAPHPWPWTEDQIADDSARPFENRISAGWAPDLARFWFLDRFNNLSRRLAREGVAQ